MPDHGPDDDQAAGLLAPHHRQHGPGQVGDTEHVGPQDRLEDVRGHVLEPAVGHHPAFRDGHVDAAVLGQHGGHRGLDGGVLRDVDRMRDGVDAPRRTQSAATR